MNLIEDAGRFVLVMSRSEVSALAELVGEATARGDDRWIELADRIDAVLFPEERMRDAEAFDRDLSGWGPSPWN